MTSKSLSVSILVESRNQHQKYLNSIVPYYVPNFPILWINQDTPVVDDPQNHQKQSLHSSPGKDFFHHHQLIPAAPCGTENNTNKRELLDAILHIQETDGTGVYL